MCLCRPLWQGAELSEIVFSSYSYFIKLLRKDVKTWIGFVEHKGPDLCAKVHGDRCFVIRGVAYQKSKIFLIITAPTSGAVQNALAQFVPNTFCTCTPFFVPIRQTLTNLSVCLSVGSAQAKFVALCWPCFSPDQADCLQLSVFQVSESLCRVWCQSHKIWGG